MNDNENTQSTNEDVREVNNENVAANGNTDDKEQVDTIKEAYNILNNGWNKQIVLYGPPGTSKTYSSTIISAMIISGSDDKLPYDSAKASLEEYRDQYKIVQFHPSYSYEDFVRGISVNPPKDGGQPTYEPEPKIFELYCDEARKHEDKKYVLVIDEINRAPLASVLGELIFGLEKRGEEIYTSYDVKEKKEDGNDHSKPLVVPKNLYIIGTMNTADRSIGSMDYAVRRRFAFIPVLPQKEKIKDTWKNEAVGRLATDLFEKLIVNNETGIFAKVSEDIEPDDIRIGHTYFLGQKKEDKPIEIDAELEYLEFRLNYQILPICYEYIKDGLLSGFSKKEELDHDLGEIFKNYTVNDNNNTYKVEFKKSKFTIKKPQSTTSNEQGTES